MKIKNAPGSRSRGAFFLALIFVLGLPGAVLAQQASELEQLMQLQKLQEMEKAQQKAKPQKPAPAVRPQAAAPSAAPPEQLESDNCQIIELALLQRGELRKVVDGDSLALAGGEKIRLIGVNTPEFGKRGASPQPGAEKARDFVEDFLADDEVYYRVGQEPRDRYQRLLAHVYNSAGENLAQALLAEGHGWHVVIPPNHSQAGCLSVAEQKARESSLGVWALDQYPVLNSAELAEPGFQRLLGQVSAVKLERVWKITLDDRLDLLVYPEFQGYFSKEDLAATEGKVIEVRGWATKKRQRWRMTLQSPQAFTVR